MLGMEHNGAGGREAPAGVPDPELAERAQRRRFTAEYKLRILREADAAVRPGGSAASSNRVRVPARERRALAPAESRPRTRTSQS